MQGGLYCSYNLCGYSVWSSSLILEVVLVLYGDKNVLRRKVVSTFHVLVRPAPKHPKYISLHWLNVVLAVSLPLHCWILFRNQMPSLCLRAHGRVYLHLVPPLRFIIKTCSFKPRVAHFKHWDTLLDPFVSEEPLSIRHSILRLTRLPLGLLFMQLLNFTRWMFRPPLIWT